ncbi:zinc ABC transporter substrate-binding protein [Thiomicrorhabdus arctica]|jgi:zinc transport system substrate-binding protein|uniref:zinc ABC transporter substrate-binding protein n=1 Tax=Thiomicrorhabdus arctica TaxID=131540 RepID=UPI00036E6F10|nr:zinc ABC transporter substrate-binding protein [Thiomicrorhabdus arctica]
MNDRIAPNTLLRKRVLSLMSVFLLGLAGNASALTVTVSIPPLAGIIAPLLGPADELHVLLKPGVSPHGFQLRPSHVRLLQDSDLVISVGTPVDAWIVKPLQLVNKTPIAMARLPNVERLALRQGGLWEDKHLHSDELTHRKLGSDAHEADNDSVNHSQGNPVENSHLDGHLWMSLYNAKQMVIVVSQQLQAKLPGQKEAIQKRAADWLTRLDKTNLQIMTRLAKVQGEPFLVLHDAFQYFEHHYGLNGVGSIRLNPELAPSLKRVHELRERIKDGHVTCLFKEPQFPEKRITSVVSGLDVKLGSLDPMGTSYVLNKPFMQYDAFLTALSNQFYSCLTKGKVL